MEPEINPSVDPVLDPPAFSIPTEYAEKEYMKEIKSSDDLYKSYDNLQQLLGKRPVGVPSEGATDEEWNTYHNTLRPETAEAYEFDDSVLPEGFKRDEEGSKAIKDIFHKAGLTAKQARLVQSEYEKTFAAESEKGNQLSLANDTNFEELASSVFGERKDEAINISKGLLEKYAPEEMKQHIAGLDNNSLMLIAGVLDKVNSTFISEEGAGGEGGGAGGANTQDKRDEAIKLMASPEFKDAFHPRHNEVKQKVNDIYASLK